MVNEKESISISGSNGKDDCGKGAVAPILRECKAMRRESVKEIERNGSTVWANADERLAVGVIVATGLDVTVATATKSSVGKNE
jgi:hypothetical protein